ncbi:TolB family protein [Agromyces sp. NPDC056379]|uniref:TolB family protein n=1 Tax=unclassified Agromyces TaxID=2639701 RepID=UPI0035D83D82
MTSAHAQFVAIGVALVLVGAISGCGVTATLHAEATPSPSPVFTPRPNPMATVGEGWIAYSTPGPEEDIFFVEAGSVPHLVLESDGASRGQVCPAFSPDGTRLASGQGGYGQMNPQDGALVITDLDAKGHVAASEVIPLDGLRQQPCPIWSPDGRWVAFGVGSAVNFHTWAYGVARDVWLFDTKTSEIRRLPKLSATDIEWAGDSSQVYIAARNGIEVYSLADDRTRLLDDSRGVVALSASPDGGSLAVERRRDGPVGLTDHFELVLMRVDGTNRRVLVEDYAHNLGIGPVWSPDGNRIVFQGGEGAPLFFRAGESFTDGEKDEVIVVIVGDDDALGPFGTQTVLAPIQTTEGEGTRHWLPAAVSWAPDSAALRFIGWELLVPEGGPASSALLVVPVEGAAAPEILWEGAATGPPTSVPQNDFQGWSR